ncbi:MAG: hypothetical protein KAS32_11100 [Candidatus Peribacteraceae bacterium]|nr:hypothetical protein [Candidatus Peribacteraceae bacterium]
MGTWAIPYNKGEATAVRDTVNKLLNDDYEDRNIDVQQQLFGVTGDDCLWDDIGAIESKAKKDIADTIKKYIKQLLKEYESDPTSFGGNFSPEALDILKTIVVDKSQTNIESA